MLHVGRDLAANFEPGKENGGDELGAQLGND
jgi:hypothetical protein